MTDNERRPRPDADRVAGDGTAPEGRRWTAAAGFALIVFVASVVPVPSASSGPGGVFGGRLAGALPVDVGLTAPFHFVGYAVLAALLGRAMAAERPVAALAVAATGAIAATAFGFGIEVVQAPIPWRSFSWLDAAVNAAGAVVGAGGYAFGRDRSFRRAVR